jgi:hypothetical protein
MSCEHCTDPDGNACLPQHGLAPHTQTDSGITTGWMPAKEWPECFIPDHDSPEAGTYYCPHCREGLDEVTPDQRRVREMWEGLDALLEDALSENPAAKYGMRKIMIAGVQAAIRVNDSLKEA